MEGDRGVTFGAYEILAKLGEGGMGEVYRAHDARLGRDVALKLLPADLAADPERRARLVNEARAAASLNHPNICTIYEVGEAGGQHFIAMEVIDGEALSARIAARPVSSDELLRIGVELADGVAHAHDRGIVHRDLKSGNVMITRGGRVKVLDFGLATRARGAALSDLTTMHLSAPHTRSNEILGTLPYMAPEQLRAEPADTRSDVWALGIILHEMARGARPFGGTSGFDVSAAILREPPPPLPASVPAALQAVIGRCLEKEPARRYQRAGELKAALEAIRADPSASAIMPAPASPRRAWVATAAVVLTMLVSAAAIWMAYSTGSREAAPPARGSGPRTIQSIAVLPLENRSGNPDEDYFVAGMHEALITDLARIGLQKVIAKASADAYLGTKKSPREIGQELGVQGLVTGSVVRGSNRVEIRAQLVEADTGAVIWANRYERPAGDVLSLQNDIVGAIAREVRAQLTTEQRARLAAARPVNAAAHDSYLKGRALFLAFVNAPFDMTRLETAVRQFEDAISIDATYAPPHAGVSLMYLTASQASLRPPREMFPKARAAALQAVALDDGLPEAHAALAEVNLWYDWNWVGAAREVERALALNPDSPDALRASLEYQLLVAARADDAARTSQRIISVDPINPFSRTQPVWTAFNSRRYDESIGHALTLRELNPNNIIVPFFLAANYAAKGMRAEAHAECEKVMTMLSGAYVMQVIGVCAWAYAAVGETAEARRLLRRLEQPPAGVWLDPCSMAQVYGVLGDATRAIAWLEKGIEERSPNMAYLKTSVFWDSVRADARFQAVLRQMNFPQ